MNATKFVIATVTAVSVLGAISLAYAQTTAPSENPSNTGAQQPMSPSTQGVPMDSTMPNSRGSTGTMNAPATRPMDGTATTTSTPGGTVSSDGSGMQTERAARADRN